MRFLPAWGQREKWFSMQEKDSHKPLEQHVIWAWSDGEKAFRTKTEKHRMRPQHRDHGTCILMSSP